jgi:hypothetical protein
MQSAPTRNLELRIKLQPGGFQAQIKGIQSSPATELLQFLCQNFGREIGLDSPGFEEQHDRKSMACHARS